MGILNCFLGDGGEDVVVLVVTSGLCTDSSPRLDRKGVSGTVKGSDGRRLRANWSIVGSDSSGSALPSTSSRIVWGHRRTSAVAKSTYSRPIPIRVGATWMGMVAKDPDGMVTLEWTVSWSTISRSPFHVRNRMDLGDAETVNCHTSIGQRIGKFVENSDVDCGCFSDMDRIFID